MYNSHELYCSDVQPDFASFAVLIIVGSAS